MEYECMKIYHGGYMEIKNPQILASKYAKDFGQGYYCTELKAQAIRWALAKFKYPTHQICFHSKKALNCLTFICSEKYDR
jgi:hypothetical protein